MDHLFENQPEKLDFLKNIQQQNKPKSIDTAVPFLLAAMKTAKSKNLSFTRSEIELLAAELSKDLSEEEKQRIQKLINYVK